MSEASYSDDNSSIYSFRIRKDKKKRLFQCTSKKQLIIGPSSTQITAISLSQDASYLAVGNQDGILCIYSVNDSYSHNSPIFKPAAMHTFQGHEAAILDLSWSKHNFIATASVDKTVRLWHVRHNNCLCAFVHQNIVTSVKFHPFDDRFILTGCLDSRVRVWASHLRKVLYWNELANNAYITAVAFTQDATMVAVGTFSGDLVFYSFEGARVSLIVVRSKKKSQKITSIESVVSRSSEDEKLLVTCNDGKLRMYNLRDKSLYCIYRGGDFKGSQLRAAVDDDGKFILCPGLDRQISLWTIDGNSKSMVNSVMTRMALSSDAGNKSVSETFEAIDDGQITSMLIAPRALCDKLQGSQELSFPSSRDLEGVYLIVGDSTGKLHILENDTTITRSRTVTGTSSGASSLSGKEGVLPMAGGVARVGRPPLKKSLSLQFGDRKAARKLQASPPPAIRRKGSISNTLASEGDEGNSEMHFQARMLNKEHNRGASEPMSRG